MRTLHHLPLSPFCRKIRLVMNEKDLEYRLVQERVWERREEFLTLNPAGEVPVLEEADGRVLADSGAITEYLDEVYPDRPLIGFDPAGRAETRRLVSWFDVKFNEEVTKNIVTEKVMKRFMGMGAPEPSVIRAGLYNIEIHLDYIDYLIERRNWLAGEDFTVADIAASAHLSCIDYLGDVPWEGHETAKGWYARLKSRPSFRPLLGDHIAGMPPPKDYANLDF